MMAGWDWGTAKGLDTARVLSRSVGFRSYVGDVQGAYKAELLACALPFPTRLEDSFGLVMVQALMSETPVISDRGACPEIISEGVGFVCRDRSDYQHTRDRLEDMHSHDCRAEALRDFHYLRMIDYYVDQYRHEVAACAGAGGTSARAGR